MLAGTTAIRSNRNRKKHGHNGSSASSVSANGKGDGLLGEPKGNRAVDSRRRTSGGGDLRTSNPKLLSPSLVQTLCEHAAGNLRLLMNMANDLLVAACCQRRNESGGKLTV